MGLFDLTLMLDAFSSLTSGAVNTWERAIIIRGRSGDRGILTALEGWSTHHSVSSVAIRTRKTALLSTQDVSPLPSSGDKGHFLVS